MVILLAALNPTIIKFYIYVKTPARLMSNYCIWWLTSWRRIVFKSFVILSIAKNYSLERSEKSQNFAFAAWQILRYAQNDKSGGCGYAQIIFYLLIANCPADTFSSFEVLVTAPSLIKTRYLNVTDWPFFNFRFISLLPLVNIFSPSGLAANSP